MFETLQFLGETNWQFISLQLTSSLPASSWGWPSSCVPALHINNVLQVILHLQQWHNDTICASQPQTFQFNSAASPFWLREGEGRGVTKRYWLCRWSLQMSCLSSMVSRIWSPQLLWNSWRRVQLLHLVILEKYGCMLGCQKSGCAGVPPHLVAES